MVEPKFYLERNDIEDRVESQIRTDSDDLVCLVGPRGCGKSSIGFKIKNNLSKNKLRRTFVIPVNIRKEVARKYFNTKSESTNYIRKYIINYYLKEFEPTNKPGLLNPLYELFAFILDSEIPEKFKPEPVFNIYQKLVSRSILKKNKLKNKSLSYYEWISEYYNDNEEIFLEILDTIDIIELSYALSYLRKYEKQIIWIDNIDALDEPDQVTVVNSINKLQKSSVETLTYIIAVREENIFRENQLSDFGTAPFRLVIYWKDPYRHKSEPSHEAFNMPVVTINELKRIVQKRIDFTIEIQNRFGNDLKIEKKKLISEFGINDSIVKEIDKEINEFLPLLDEQDEGIIRSLSEKIVEIFFNEKVHYLANNSLRVLLPLHRDFLAFELRRDFDGKDSITKPSVFNPSAAKFDHYYLQTELLQFITSHNQTLMFNLFDLITRTKTRRENGDTDLYCFLPNLIITTTWNLCIENTLVNKEEFCRIPKIDDVVKRLMFIGFADDEILKTIFDMYYQNQGGTSNFISIQTNKEIQNETNLENNMRMRPTYRGKAAVSSVTNSFGYILALYFRQINDTDAYYSKPENSDTDIQKVINALKYIGESHLISLLQIRNNKYQNKPN